MSDGTTVAAIVVGGLALLFVLAKALGSGGGPPREGPPDSAG